VTTTLRGRVMATVASAVLLAGMTAPGAVAGVGADDGRTCRESLVPVSAGSQPVVPGRGSLPTITPGEQQIFVRFCQPASGPSSTVQVLVHGITYDHRYWNIVDPDGTERYSWEAAAAKAGYATLAIDRLGAGRSTHPPSPQVDINSNAAVVRAIVHALRTGAISPPGEAIKIEKVALVGHSYGSITSWFAASDNPEIDAVVLTGATHNIREVGTPFTVIEPLYPAALDPQYAGSGLDPGYQTQRPGTRYATWYAPDTNVDERVLAADEAIKGTVTFSELNNYLLYFRSRVNITAPVYLLIGSRDSIFCSLAPGDLGAPCTSEAALIENERPWLGPGVPSIAAHITPGAGHALNALRSSTESFDAAQSWLLHALPPR
jgi:pimeloyl-ACP methyl ester carboxylesterase